MSEMELIQRRDALVKRRELAQVQGKVQRAPEVQRPISIRGIAKAAFVFKSKQELAIMNEKEHVITCECWRCRKELFWQNGRL